MSAGRRGGNGEVADLTVRILRDIRGGIGELRDEVRKTNERLERLEATTNARFERLEATTNARFERLESATVAGFRGLESRFDHLLDFAGDRYRDHEERLRVLEERVLRGQ